MATQILRTIDRWRFEAPLAIALAAAAGFAAMTMPQAIFATLPMAGRFGHPGQIGLATLAALLCGGLGYVAMRRPAKRVAVAEEEDDLEPLHAPLDMPATPIGEEEPLRVRRADRHPDAPPRAPIRASRDLGEPFMEVGTPVASATVEAPIAAPEPSHAAIEDAEFTAIEDEHPVEAEAPDAIEPVMDAPVMDAPAEDAPPEIVEPIVEPIVEAPVVETVAEEPASVELAPEPESEPEHAPEPEPVVSILPRPLPSVAREDGSIAAMMERLSAGMQRRGEATGRPIGAPRDRSPALRDALHELNRLAERRG